MTVTSGSISLKKDQQNLIGISIGGGAPYCPCLYVVQIFDNTPAAKEGTLAAGDEIVGVNGNSVKGRTKVEVARMIQSVKVSLKCHPGKCQFATCATTVESVLKYHPIGYKNSV